MILNTENTNMRTLYEQGWTILSKCTPELNISPPSTFVNLHVPIGVKLIEDNLHRDLLEESLENHSELWTILAQV
jgi:hypothetical protein